MRGNTGGGGAMPRTGPHSQPTSRPSSRRQNHTAAAAAPSAAQPASVDALDSPPGSVSPDEVLFNRTMSGMGTELADIAELALGEGEGAGKLGAGAGPGHRDGVDYDATEEGADGDGGGACMAFPNFASLLQVAPTPNPSPNLITHQPW